jgi:hypothetical protein
MPCVELELDQPRRRHPGCSSRVGQSTEGLLITFQRVPDGRERVLEI